MMQKSSILIISGKRGSGKTTFCKLIAEILKSNGWDVAGLLSLPVIKQGSRVAIDALDIRSGVRQNLASINHHGRITSEVQTGLWIFDIKALAWCNSVFQSAVPSDFLIVDEIGPLEFNQGQGFLDALAALDSGEFICAMVVIRPELLAVALKRWPTAKVIELTDANQGEQQAIQLAAEMTSGIHPPKR